MSTENTDEIQKKIDESASFYKNYLNIDNRLAEYGLQTIQPYFQGSTCLEIGLANGIVTRHLVKLF
jgi:poly-beta-hydroxyalkanoate depolymerase